MTVGLPSELAASLRAGFPEYDFEVAPAGAGWVRIFVHVRHETLTLVSIGRLSLRPVEPGIYEVAAVKHYKPRDLPYRSEDAFFYQLDAWWTTNERIRLNDLVIEAIRRWGAKMRAKQAWRDAHPTRRSRPRLETSWMGEFRRLAADRARAAIDERSAG